MAPSSLLGKHKHFNLSVTSPSLSWIIMSEGCCWRESKLFKVKACIIPLFYCPPQSTQVLLHQWHQKKGGVADPTKVNLPKWSDVIGSFWADFAKNKIIGMSWDINLKKRENKNQYFWKIIGSYWFLEFSTENGSYFAKNQIIWMSWVCNLNKNENENQHS